MSLALRVNRRSVVSSWASFSGFRYRRSVGSSAASVILPTRRARLSGFFLILAISSLRPTMIPACGPPRSLSPLKVTMSAPDSTVSRTVTSSGRPQSRMSISVPLPRSTIIGRLLSCAMRATSASVTALVKPVMA
ncbi:hypothetical protein SDC9_212102 [bioreactor metagenome]|uniref:Uncharacterized protein n=1 Tax=bioreactor metagenome TaxID=1076179 RepID=A0A645JML5_9ZZZZ